MTRPSPFVRLERAALLVWAGLFAVACSVLLWLQGRLPERVASRFDWSGHVDGWMGHETFFLVNAGALLFLNGWIAGLVLYARKNREVLPARFGRFGIGFNFPNREYWLATVERAREAMGRMATCLAATGCFLNVIFLGVFHMIFQENGGSPLVVVPFPLMVGGILALALALVGVIPFVFRVSPDDRPGL